MPQPILDADTSKVLTDGEEVANLLESKGWSVIKAKFDEKLLDLQNIHNIDEDNLAIDLKARMLAVKTMYDWMKQDVYGFAEQARANSELFRNKEDNGFIERG